MAAVIGSNCLGVAWILAFVCESGVVTECLAGAWSANMGVGVLMLELVLWTVACLSPACGVVVVVAVTLSAVEVLLDFVVCDDDHSNTLVPSCC